MLRYTNTRLDAAIANDKKPEGIDDNDYIKTLDTRLGMKRKVSYHESYKDFQIIQKTYFNGKDYSQGTYFWTVEEQICYVFHLIIRVLLEFIFIAFAYWIQARAKRKFASYLFNSLDISIISQIKIVIAKVY